jgi:hypothetical protein
VRLRGLAFVQAGQVLWYTETDTPIPTPAQALTRSAGTSTVEAGPSTITPITNFPKTSFQLLLNDSKLGLIEQIARPVLPHDCSIESSSNSPKSFFQAEISHRLSLKRFSPRLKDIAEGSSSKTRISPSMTRLGYIPQR